MIEAFLESIRRSMDDDAPRMVLADWLQARGDLRGEFIVLECTLARARDARVQDRRDELLRLHGASWGAPLFALDASPDDEPRPDLRPTRFFYRRGFVEEVHYMGDDLDNLGELLRAEPIVSLHVSGPLGESTRAQIAEGAVPELAWLRSMTIGGSAGVLASPHLRISSLRFTRDLDVPSADAMVTGAARPVELLVTALPGGWAQITQEAALILAGSPVLEHVERLEADSAPLAELAGQLISLKHLRLRRGPVDGPAMEAFERHLPKLESIAIRVRSDNEADVSRILAKHLRKECVKDVHVFGDDDGGPNFPF
jgi:uncharacterized protein (TIGR02996 family)